MGYGFVDELLRMPPVHQGTVVKERHRTTLHNRSVTKEELYIVARFIHGLTRVVVPKYQIPRVLELGVVVLRLPIWSKEGDGWHHAGYEFFKREALGVTVEMMRAIERYTGITESSMLAALHSLSMIAVLQPLVDETPRQYRHRVSGNLINPSDGTSMLWDPVDDAMCFVLDKKRVFEWIKKEKEKKAHASSRSEENRNG